jgi:predicted SAM-dependent methyltransferase
LKGFCNIDINEKVKPDIVCDVRKLPFDDESVDFIYAGHLLEHLFCDKVPEYLKEWKRVMKKGAKLVIVVPDIGEIAKCYIRGEANTDQFLTAIFGQMYSWELPYQRHLYAYDYPKLIESVTRVKWSKVERLNFGNLPEEIKLFVPIAAAYINYLADWQMGVTLTK